MTDLRGFGSRRLLIAICATCVLLALYWGLSDKRAVDHQWIEVVTSPVEHRVGLVGRIVAGESVTMTAPFEGVVSDKRFSEDQRVERGELLLRLDPSLLDMRIRDALGERLKAESAVQVLEHWAQGEEMSRARRALSSSQSALADTRRKLAETRSLLEQGIVPRMELDNLSQQLGGQLVELQAAQADLHRVSERGTGEHMQIARMQQANAKARHEALLALQGHSEIRAPFAGIIRLAGVKNQGATERPIEQGVQLSQGQPLFGIANLEHLNVQAKVHELDINQLSAGMAVDISGDGFSDTLRGTLTSVGAQAITSNMHGDSASYHVSISLPTLDAAQQRRLRLGMSARLSIIIRDNPNAVVLPADAIGEEDGKHFVIQRTHPNDPGSRREITVGAATVAGVQVKGIESGWVQRQVRIDEYTSPPETCL